MKSHRIKFVLYTFALLMALLFVPVATAQTVVDVQPVAPAISVETQNVILNVLSGLMVRYPFIATLIAIMGSMRIWAKPVLSAVRAIIALTSTKYDDDVLSKTQLFFTENKLGKTFAYLLDWVASIKIVAPGK